MKTTRLYTFSLLILVASAALIGCKKELAPQPLPERKELAPLPGLNIIEEGELSKQELIPGDTVKLQDANLVLFGYKRTFIAPAAESYHWYRFDEETNQWKELGTDNLLTVEEPMAGTYKYRLETTEHETTVNKEFSVLVQSPYIAEILDFCPAPAQFVNELPKASSYADAISQLNEQLCYDAQKQLVSLGGWGGYIVFKFDHPIVNRPHANDLMIWGNVLNPNPNCEAGIIWVAQDKNGNGKVDPEDTWIELAGSVHKDPSWRGDPKHPVGDPKNYRRGYTLTYYKPEPEPDPSTFTQQGADYCKFRGVHPSHTGGDTVGWVQANYYHLHSYWPAWLSDKKELTFTGTRLPDNYRDEKAGKPGNRYYRQYPWQWGYVDNLANWYGEGQQTEELGFDLDNAIDEAGKPVHLDKVDFIKVQNGQLCYCGWIGESSTEITTAWDMSMLDYKKHLIKQKE